MKFIIYKITNTINGKFYIGKHQTTDLNDGYMGSGKLIKAAIKKYGQDKFKKEILFEFNTEKEMNLKEKELVIVSDQTYNLCEGGKGGFSFINRTRDHKEHNQKLADKRDYNKTNRDYITDEWKSKKRKQAKHNWETGVYKYIPSTKGLKHTEAARQKMSQSHKGENNSQFNTCWITNGIESKKIKKQELEHWIELGYNKGRMLSN